MSPRSDDYEEDESEEAGSINYSSSELGLVDSPTWSSGDAEDQPELPQRRNLLEEALRRQVDDDGSIRIDDALTFVSEMMCRANQAGRVSQRQTPRSRNSQRNTTRTIRVEPDS
jgi:hypothetical protein